MNTRSAPASRAARAAREHHRTRDAAPPELLEGVDEFDLRVRAVDVQLALAGEHAVDAGDEAAGADRALPRFVLVDEATDPVGVDAPLSSVDLLGQRPTLRERTLLGDDRGLAVGRTPEHHLDGWLRHVARRAEPRREPVAVGLVGDDDEAVTEPAEDAIGVLDQRRGGERRLPGVDQQEVRDEAFRNVVVEVRDPMRERLGPCAHPGEQAAFEGHESGEVVHAAEATGAQRTVTETVW